MKLYKDLIIVWGWGILSFVLHFGQIVIAGFKHSLFLGVFEVTGFSADRKNKGARSHSTGATKENVRESSVLTKIPV